MTPPVTVTLRVAGGRVFPVMPRAAAGLAEWWARHAETAPDGGFRSLDDLRGVLERVAASAPPPIAFRLEHEGHELGVYAAAAAHTDQPREEA